MTFGAQMQPIADSLIRQFGGGRTCTLRRWEEVPNPKTGDTELTLHTVVDGVIFVVLQKNERRYEAQRRRDTDVILSGSQLAGHQVDGAWTLQPEGTDRELELADIEATDPDGNTVVWEATFKEGATVGGTV